MWHAFNKHSEKAVVASSMELKAKDISSSGWKERSDGVRDIRSTEMGGQCC